MRDGYGIPRRSGHPVSLNPGSIGNPDGKPGPYGITSEVRKALSKINPEAAGKVRSVVRRKEAQPNLTAGPIMRTGPYMPQGAGQYGGSANKRVPGPEITDSGHGSSAPQRKY